MDTKTRTLNRSNYAPNMLLVIDHLLDRFEDEYSAGRIPDLQEFLDQAPEVARVEVFHELLLLELSYRSFVDAGTAEESYKQRFPAYLEQVKAVFHSPVPTVTYEAPLKQPAPIPLGTERYELRRELARGGMGVVYDGWDRILERIVAVKVLGVHTDHTGLASRFVEEARIMGQLQHPSIPAVHDLGTLSDGRPFLAMKLIQGETLHSYLQQQSHEHTHPNPRFFSIFEMICQAVGYAHANGVIHRDLKPANIMVGDFGEVLVMDWGLAKILNRPAEPSTTIQRPPANVSAVRKQREAGDVTRMGSVLGTPAFMAPEQATGALDLVDQRSDVFGLGAILAVMLTGKPPYTANTTQLLLAKASAGDVTDCFARLDKSGAEPDWIALCKKCLAPNQSDRPTDAGEVAALAAALRTAAELRMRQAELGRVKVEEKRKRLAVLRLLAGAVALLIIVAAIGTIFAIFYKVAEASRVEAETQRQLADQAKTKAEQSELNEAHARQMLEIESRKLATIEYGRTMQVVYQEFRENNITTALALLETTQPDFRGWEWYYLHRLCNSNLHTLKGHDGIVLSASFNLDGSRVASFGSDNSARIWDAKTGAELSQFRVKGFVGNVVSAAFSADGSLLLTGSKDRTAKLWDTKTGNELHTLLGHTGWVTCASFSADGTYVATGSADKTAKVWHTKSGKEISTLRGSSEIGSVSFNPNGTRVITGDWHGWVRLWNIKTGAEVLSRKVHVYSITSASLIPDTEWIMTSSIDRTAKIINLSTGDVVVNIQGHTGIVYSASVSPDKRLLLTASSDQTARLWDIPSGAEVYSFRGHTDELYGASFSPDGLQVLTRSRDRTARIWNAKPKPEHLILRDPSGAARTVSVGANGTQLVTSGSDGSVRMWDFQTGAELALLKEHSGVTTFASFSSDGQLLATASKDQTARVWDVKTRKVLSLLKGHTSWLNSAVFDNNCERIVTSSLDKTARVWIAQTGQLERTLAGHIDEVTYASFSPDGRRIVTVSADQTARVWDAQNGTLDFILKGHTSTVRTAAFNSDSTLIVTGGDDKTAKVWDANTGSLLVTLSGHTSAVRTAVVSPDSSRIITGSWDRTVRVWDVLTGAELLTIKDYPLPVEQVVFSNDGSRIFTTGERWFRELDSRPVNKPLRR